MRILECWPSWFGQERERHLGHLNSRWLGKSQTPGSGNKARSVNYTKPWIWFLVADKQGMGCTAVIPATSVILALKRGRVRTRSRSSSATQRVQGLPGLQKTGLQKQGGEPPPTFSQRVGPVGNVDTHYVKARSLIWELILRQCSTLFTEARSLRLPGGLFVWLVLSASLLKVGFTTMASQPGGWDLEIQTQSLGLHGKYSRALSTTP